MLRDLDVWTEAEMEQNLCYFAVDLFVVSTVTFCSALSVDWCDPRWRQRARIGSLEESISEALL